MTDARHGNSILNNGQQVFTPEITWEKAVEIEEKCWKRGWIGRICTGETVGKK
jgi:hypothetical protein